MAIVSNNNARISYSCYYKENRQGEQFVEEHILSFQLSGSLLLNTGSKVYEFNAGDFRFIKRNQLIKFVKQPQPEGEFRSISVHFDQDLLRDISLEYGYTATLPSSESIISLKPGPLLTGYVDSILSLHRDGVVLTRELQALKLREGVLMLIEVEPKLKDILFNFSQPHKIDLQAFMEKNFRFNVQMQRFAYLTGRSLATFKRDFKKIFDTTPGNWLLNRRLKEAHYLIKEKNRSASHVYLEVGFEDLSHFSYAFKGKYGISPSRL
ncbi:helix-turn-helix domain-containing protein [Mucilaginibacter auburnensis]|uniref:AraC-like DNA-binding protein n=1 Tax=Mucilaginibacter auburnensis TaxID=1457233 RepID=A0A2H9VW94_9SPHI|nr:AraC family transcriptional regulator [Mucilaginibacter auburnensis]PJJ85071.1 AraC-like DNA-binding protein [Mucilaginibacter auburnensis]